MAEPNEQARWAEPNWLTKVSTWIDSTLAAQGYTRIGPLEPPQIRPWSAMVRVPTTAGLCYFKATASAFAHESVLTQTLACWYPADIVPVVAMEPAQHWLLLRDSSPTLRSRLQAERSLAHWQRIWPRYAVIQQELGQRQDELLALGVPDHRLAQLPAQYAALLADPAALWIDQPDGLTSAEYQQLVAFGPRLDGLCRQLAAAGLPESLHHDDLHDANIFVQPQGYLLSDWAESCVTHLFFTLVVGLRSIAYRFAVALDGPEINHLRTLYLAPWQGYAPLATLTRAARLAECIGTGCRALTWYQATTALRAADQAEHGEAVPRWLRHFLLAQQQLVETNL